jgi:A/G-specific adenine glycosylase
VSEFSRLLIRWQRRHGRHYLPWQNTRDAYRIWLSEIMLQQTQVSTVIPYYERFLQHFPTVIDLANADLEQVMPLWSGLGYYSRARNLHACAQIVVREHAGLFPSDPQQLASLPGIGRSTAAAISAFAYGTRAAILDGNVKRVLTRAFGIEGWPNTPGVEKALWSLAESLLPPQHIETYTQGLMDLGATVCTRSSPQCAACPWQKKCIAYAQNRTTELPHPKPVKSSQKTGKRIREAHMLVLVCTDEILLEKRPASGIWGGLWSVPEFDQEDALKDYLDRTYSNWQWQTLAPRQHAFTHYTLRFTPHVVSLSKRPSRAAEPQHRWLPVNQTMHAALPAPIKQLLGELAAHMAHQSKSST